MRILRKLIGTQQKLDDELLDAVEKEKIHDVQSLIRRGANVNSKDRDGWFPLIKASKNKNIDIVKLLLENGAKVNQFIPETPSPLNLDLESKSKVDKKKRGTTSLLVSSRIGANEIVDTLLLYKADVDFQDGYGLTALHGAAQYGHYSITKSLLDKNAMINIKSTIGATPLILACTHRGDIKIVELLLKRGADINACTKENITALYHASEDSLYDVVKVLIANGVDVNIRSSYDGNTALHVAAMGRNKHIIKLLLEANANKNISNNEGLLALDIAFNERDKDSLKLLDPYAVYELPKISLLEAADLGDSATVKELLDLGEDINKGNKYNATPLYMALQKLVRGEIEPRSKKAFYINSVKLLIERGANINSKLLDDGETPLILACCSPSYEEIVEILLNNGADINAKAFEQQETALHHAASCGNPNIVRILLEKGADVLSKDANGDNVLEYLEKELWGNKKDQENYIIIKELLQNAVLSLNKK